MPLFAGRRPLNPSFNSAFQTHINKIRNRWNIAIHRTTGIILFDIILLAFKLFFSTIKLVLRVIVGTRPKFSDLLTGAKFTAGTIEDIREIETFVFASLAAIEGAMEYAENIPAENTYRNGSFYSEILGLAFSGATFAATAAASSKFENLLNGALGEEDGDWDDPEADFSEHDGGADIDVG